MATTATLRRRQTPPKEIAATYSRYSSDLQDVSSIEQQQRVCTERAEANGHTIPPRFHFADEAISGTKRDRSEMNRMLEHARAQEFGTLYFSCLSRLARESVITLPMLKELVNVCGIRVISVSEGIDSDRPDWELNAMIRAWMHQEFIKVLRAAVIRGQEGAVHNAFSVGDWCFGYGSEPIPGSESGRVGRNKKPRKRYTINEEHARWVRQVFQWYVEEGWSISQIARELSKMNVPKDHRSTTRGWKHPYVVRLLSNTKYIGLWPWGRMTNTRDPFTGNVTPVPRPPEEVTKYLRECPELRIVDDELFARAQARLSDNNQKYAGWRSSDGKLRGSRAGQARQRHLLQGLIRCGNCGSSFHVDGSFARYLVCSGSKSGLCSMGTRLPRELAENMILEAVQDAIANDNEWKSAILEMAVKAWTQTAHDRPAEHDADVRSLKALEVKITRLVDELENSDDPDLRRRLGERQRERDEIKRRMAGRERHSREQSGPPTAEWVDAELKNLRDLLNGDRVAAAASLSKLIGKVVVSPIRLTGSKRLVLQGTFRLATRIPISSELGSPAVEQPSDPGFERTLIFSRVELPPWAAFADYVKEAFDAGIRMKDIPVPENCQRGWIAKALAYWYTSRNLPVPDGRKLRDRLNEVSETQKLAPEVMELYDQSMPLQDIARRLGCDRNTVTKAIAFWHKSRGLPVPDGRHRRMHLRLERERDQDQQERRTA